MFDDKSQEVQEIAGFRVDPADPKIRKELETVESGLYQSAKNNWTQAKTFVELALARRETENIEVLRQHRPDNYEDYIKSLGLENSEKIIELTDDQLILEHDECVARYNQAIDNDPPDLAEARKATDDALALFGDSDLHRDLFRQAQSESKTFSSSPKA